MPELPEVETVRNALKEIVIGKKIVDVTVLHPRTIAMPDVETFKKEIKNQVITDIKRRGKWLLFELNDYFLLSHLRMEGKYFFKKKSDSYEKHELIGFNFSDNTSLRYDDTRKFGRMFLLPKEEVYNVKPLSEIGLEPFDSELTTSYLKEKFKNKKLPIKTILLDQSIIAGIGNIYANEILFLAKINPLTKANEVHANELALIIKYTKEVLERAIKMGGSTISSYASVDGVHGKFQNELNVHGKVVSCTICGNEIKKIKVGGRGTYYCSECQK